MTEIDFNKVWIEEYPSLGTAPIPTEPCISPDYYRLEQERVFKRVWLKVGRIEDAPNPGDYFVQDIAVANASVIVVRGNDGELRAFHNICPHRGNKLMWPHERCGSARTIKCRFHGWTFANNGRLMAVPDEKMFYDLKKEERGLLPVALDTWEGFIFINLDPEPRETLAEFLGEMGRHLSGFPFASFGARYAYRAELNANWKVCLDAFSEAYHALFIHKETVGLANVSKDNPMAHPVDVRLYDKHRSTVVFGNPDATPFPTAKLAAQFGLTAMVRGIGMDTLPPQINPERRREFNFELAVLFPSFIIHVRPGEYFTHQFWPLGPDRTLWEGVNCLPQVTRPSQRWSQEYSHTMRRNAWLEDTSTMEATHAALSTGALKDFMISDPEILVRHGYKVLEDYVGFYGREAVDA